MQDHGCCARHVAYCFPLVSEFRSNFIFCGGAQRRRDDDVCNFCEFRKIAAHSPTAIVPRGLLTFANREWILCCRWTDPIFGDHRVHETRSRLKNAQVESAGPSKMQGWYMQDGKCGTEKQGWKKRDRDCWGGKCESEKCGTGRCMSVERETDLKG